MDFDSYTLDVQEDFIPGRDLLIGFNSAGGERISLYGYYYDDGEFQFGTDLMGINAVSANNNLAGGVSLPEDPLSGIKWQTPYSATDGSDGFTLSLEMLTLDTYRLKIVDDDVTKVDVTGQLTGGDAAGQGIDRLVLYGSETTAGTPEPGGVAYFKNLQIATPELGLAGDFNNDTKVDSADYTLWRNNLARRRRVEHQ